MDGPRPGAGRGRWVVPALCGLALVAEVVFVLVVPLPRGPMPVHVLLGGVGAQVLATIALALVPRRPELGLVGVLAVSGVLTCAPGDWQALVLAGAVPWIPLAVAWSTVRVLDGSTQPYQLRVAAAAVMVYLVGTATLAPGSSPSVLLGAATPLLGGLCVSLAARLRRARVDRAASEEQRRREQTYRALADERQRVADQLHDDLGHVLTLVVLQADRLASASPAGEVRDAAGSIRELGTRGLGSLRSALRLVDDPSAPAAVMESAAGSPETAVRAVVDEARRGGQEVVVDLSAELPLLEQSSGAALVRAVREGLTNARRHAAGAESVVELNAASNGAVVDLVLTNGAAPGTGESSPGSGRGLAGLTRGIELLGGSCHHGPTDDGGYSLRVRLPAVPS